MKYLTTLRQAKNMTQAELGVIIGVDGNAISRYERDVIKPSLDTLRRLASFFGVTIDKLLNDGPGEGEIEIRLVMNFDPMKGGIEVMDMKNGQDFTLCIDNGRLGIIGVGPLESESDIDSFLARARKELLVGLSAQREKRKIEGETGGSE